MQKTLTLSLSSQTIARLKNKIKEKKLRSIGAYFEQLFGDDNATVLTEKHILESSYKARKDYREGKLKKLDSLYDLI